MSRPRGRQPAFWVRTSPAVYLEYDTPEHANFALDRLRRALPRELSDDICVDYCTVRRLDPEEEAIPRRERVQCGYGRRGVFRGRAGSHYGGYPTSFDPDAADVTDELQYANLTALIGAAFLQLSEYSREMHQAAQKDRAPRLTNVCSRRLQQAQAAFWPTATLPALPDAFFDIDDS